MTRKSINCINNPVIYSWIKILYGTYNNSCVNIINKYNLVHCNSPYLLFIYNVYSGACIKLNFVLLLQVLFILNFINKWKFIQFKTIIQIKFIHVFLHFWFWCCDYRQLTNWKLKNIYHFIISSKWHVKLIDRIRIKFD